MSLGVMTMHKQNNWLWFVELLKNLCIIPPRYVSYYRQLFLTAQYTEI